ncbi:MAG: SRPBCC domain-containing protein [Armatimonadetes bacterium]|nr:SRPBCC domain-containing protein [Armatimonadota bacterium]
MKTILIKGALLVLANVGMSSDATTPIVASAVVSGPVAEVWKAYTTCEGLNSWMVAASAVDLRVGGYIRTSYTKGSDCTGPDVIENRILSFDPERMVSMQTVRTPERFPFKEAIKKTWVNIYFEPMGQTKTKVTCRMMGFDSTPDSVQLRKFFEQGNQLELDKLVEYFSKK